MYPNVVSQQNDGIVPHALTVSDVPVDGFWSITVYNKDGFMHASDRDAYSFNGTTAASNDDGTVTIHFGACEDERVTCLPVTSGWNYIVRLYRPRQEILDGYWVCPEAKPVCPSSNRAQICRELPSDQRQSEFPPAPHYHEHDGERYARSPWQDPFVERVVSSPRRECLDHVR